MTWVFALGQVLLTVTGRKRTLIYGSYLDDREDVTNAAWTLPF